MGQKIEGRGGWTIERYLSQYTAYVRGVSPFLFPKGVPADTYYGDYKFICRGLSKYTYDPYLYDGFKLVPMEKGQICLFNSKLYAKDESGKLVPVEAAPEFEFDYAKYLEKNKLPAPNAVSLLFGANEMQKVPMDKSASEFAVEMTLNNFKTLIAGIRRAVPDTLIIINLPVLGAEQYAWGIRLGCNWSNGMYRFHILKLCAALLKEFDGREREGFFISPMLHTLDPRSGFDTQTVCSSAYADAEITVQTNWVHPGEIGYAQMGDTLSGVIAHIKHIHEKR